MLSLVTCVGRQLSHNDTNPKKMKILTKLWWIPKKKGKKNFACYFAAKCLIFLEFQFFWSLEFQLLKQGQKNGNTPHKCRWMKSTEVNEVNGGAKSQHYSFRRDDNSNQKMEKTLWDAPMAANYAI